MLSFTIGALLFATVDSVSLRELQTMSAEIFRVQAVPLEGRTGYAQLIHEPHEDHPLGAFARENRALLTYLSQHGSSMSLTATLGPARDEGDLQRRYTTALLADSVFIASYLPLVVRYLHTQGRSVVGMDSILQSEPRSIRRSDMMRVAVRFFSPFLLEDGGVSTHVCTAFNDVRDLPGSRDLVLEGLAYAAIIAEFRPDAPLRFHDDFQAARRLMNRLVLSEDPAQKLERARGVMWGIMANSSPLALLLDEAYQQRAAYLPFRLSTE